jgi:hypothetical protein
MFLQELDLKLKSNDMWSQLVHKYETSNAYIAHKKKPLILFPYPNQHPSLHLIDINLSDGFCSFHVMNSI